jgi:molybdate transport system substrate-binding protein
MRSVLWMLCFWALALPVHAGNLTIAAAADLRFALDEVLNAWRSTRPGERIEVVYGSSGKFATQIRNGAPFDVFMSADVGLARALQADGHTAGPPQPYAFGRLGLWSRDPALARLPLAQLVASPRLRRFAIANPQHAPYGQRAEEALRHQGAWHAVQAKLVQGENVAQAAQFIDSGAAQAGLVALSLVLAMKEPGLWTPIPAEWHASLEQALVVTQRAAGNPLAQAFVQHLQTPAAREVLVRHGFSLPVNRP